MSGSGPFHLVMNDVAPVIVATFISDGWRVEREDRELNLCSRSRHVVSRQEGNIQVFLWLRNSLRDQSRLDDCFWSHHE